MSLVLNTTPGSLYSAHGDLIFVAYEATKATDNQLYPDYKYVCDVHIGGSMVARLKAFPNPDNSRGIFNIGKIVRNYLGVVFNPTMAQIRSQQFGAGKYYIDVTCKFGQDYDFTLYTNVTTDSERRYFNHYNGRLVGSLTTLSNYTNKFLTDAPGTKTIKFEDTACFMPYFPSTSGDITLSVTDGSTTKTKTISPTAQNVELLNLSPAAINAEWAGFITSSTSYYTATIGSQSFRFNIGCDPKYTTNWLHFLNKQGCYESFPFTKVSRPSVEVEKKSFGQLGYTVDNAGAVSYDTGQVLNSQNKVYASQYGEKIRLNSDLLTDAEWVWLQQLIVSPEVFIQQDGYFVPVRITNSNYEHRKIVSDGLQSLEIEVVYDKKQNAQYR